MKKTKLSCRIKYVILFCLWFVVPLSSFAQVNVRGKVSDSQNNEPLAGVTVLVKGTTIGTLTDINGSYSISAPNENSTLVFSFIGYVSQEIAVGSKREINMALATDVLKLEEVVVIGYGTAKKSDLTGSVTSVKAEDFKTQSISQVSEMLTGTIAGFNASQSATAAGGASLEIRGPKSLSAQTDPLIVLDGVIYNGSIRDINPSDIQSVDILKDASSAAVFGSKAASGVVLITTNRGKTGKPTINFSTKIGMAENINERRGLGPEEFIQFRQDYFRQTNANPNYDYYDDPNKLPAGMTVDQWRALSNAPLADNTDEWLSRLKFFPVEVANYKAGKTMDMYDEVFRKGLRQEYDLSIGGGTDNVTYYWSVGRSDNQGIIVGDEFSAIRSRLNAEFRVNNWLSVGTNTQFSDRDESGVPASMNFYVNSPYGQMFDDQGNLMRLPHGHSDNPLLDHYRISEVDKKYSLFSNLYSNVKLPFGFNFRISFQPRYETQRYMSFTTISPKLGGMSTETPSGLRREINTMSWMVDNLLTWKKEFGVHNFDLTMLANVEENLYWRSDQENKNFQPNQQLGFHGLQFGNSPSILDDDRRSTGDALMARLNYTLMGRYLLTASVRRDGFSAFGIENPRATFPAFAFAWVVSDENFFNFEPINRLKLRFSWGANGNRDIGQYAALAQVTSSLWFDGSSVRVGTFNSTLANAALRWERTTSANAGIDIAILKGRIDLSADYYDMTTTDLLMNRQLPRVTGFTNITANLGELGNKGFEMTLNTINITNTAFTWKSNFVFSLNRNKIKKLFGDVGTYTLLGETKQGELPDYTNQWFPGQGIDVIWDYDITGIWQLDEAETAKSFNLEAGDYKAIDANGDGRYTDLQDKLFIGHDQPRYRLGLRNDISFLKNFTASVFLRADLGHLGAYEPALNLSWESDDRWNRNVGPVPYWTADKPNYEYPRLNASRAGFGGGIMIYKPMSFLRVQDLSLSYNMPATIAQKARMNSVQVFAAVRNLATFTKWPGWDPESQRVSSSQPAGMTPMPRTYTIGLNFSL